MTTCLAVLAFALVVAVLATIGVRSVALRLGVVDRPDHFRKIHRRAIPRLGGVAVYLAFALPLAVLWVLPPVGLSVLLRRYPTQLLGLLAGGAVALGAGIVDDVRGLSPGWKLLLQAIAASIAIAAGHSIVALSNPFGEPLELGLLSFPITIVWLLGCMNAVNLLDGLDGLAAGGCLLMSVTLFLVSLIFGQGLCMVLVCCLSGAILGFLFFNFHPASIFLGDSGSMLLGFLVGTLSLLGTSKAHGAGAQLIPIIVLGLPLFDTGLAIVRRWSRKLPISAADRHHVHHVLLSMGLSHRRVVVTLYLACVALGGAAVLMTVERAEVTVLVLGSLAAVALTCVRLLGGVGLADLWGRFSEGLELRHREAEAKVVVEKSVARMRAAPDAGALWEAFSAALAGLELGCATLRLYRAADRSPRVLAWPGSLGEATRWLALGPDTWSARLSVRCNGTVLGELEVASSPKHGLLSPHVPELLDRARHELAAQMERVWDTVGEVAAAPEPVLRHFDEVVFAAPAAIDQEIGQHVGVS